MRERADIVSMVGRYVTLKKQGPRHWGLCPFHDEKTPSFQVHEDKQIFYCFGCGAGGDVFAFRIRHDGLDFPDAVRLLAREYGVTVPETGGGSESRSTELYQANEIASGFFRDMLRGPDGAAARRYLEERGVPEDLIERFAIGLAPARWDGLVSKLNRNDPMLRAAEQVGLIGKRQTGDGHYDRFRGRIVFPITEPGGNTLGFGGRLLGDGDGPKYLNSPESPVYHKSRVLFGLPLALDAIREAGRVVVVEGYFDLIALHRAGIRNGVAPCGTALGRDHARRIRRYTNEVVLLFDGDEAGQKAAERCLGSLLSEGLRVRAAFLPTGEDPDTLLVNKGAAALRDCVEAARPLLDHLIEHALEGVAHHAWDTADATRKVEAYLHAVADPVERAHYIRQFSSYLELSPDVVQKSVRSAATTAGRGNRLQSEAASTQSSRNLRPLRVGQTTKLILGALGAFPHLLSLLEDLEPGWLPDEQDRFLLEQLATALREHGQTGIAQLLSPVGDALSEELKATLSRIIAEQPLADSKTAERTVKDCVARLGIQALDRRSHELTALLQTCTDERELDAMLEEKQETVARKHRLASELLTQPLSSKTLPSKHPPNKQVPQL
ncbi:MAG: DNA primase [bacterium]|nr:DNA primase [bacterium]